MTNKLTEAVSRAANNFQRADVRKVEPPPISKAEAMGIPEPPMSEAHRQGLGVAGALAGKYLQSLAGTEQYLAERADHEKKIDDALWTQIQARRAAAI
jgi:hypothetical protein